MPHRRLVLPTFLVLSTLACQTPPALPHGRIVDLTHAFDQDSVYWPTAPGFETRILSQGVTPRGYYYEARWFAGAEHGGTHVDAPIHFFDGRQRVDAIPLDRLMGPGVVVDVSGKCADDRDYRVTVEDLTDWERRHGEIPADAIVLLRTGFDRFWPDRVRYLGTDARGPEAVPDLHFPGLHPDAARWLVERGTIGAVGIDTASIDHGPAADFPAHVVLAGHDVPIFENVANLGDLPPAGFAVVALPMKIRDGTGGPLRIVAIVGHE